MQLIRVAILSIGVMSFIAFSSVRSSIQITGKTRPATVSAEDVKELHQFPVDVNSYDIIGLLSDCSSTSEFSDFIAVYKKAAAGIGGNCIVVESDRNNSGLCVDATVVFLKQKPVSNVKDSQEGCIEYMKEVIRLRAVIDSLQKSGSKDK